MILRILLLSFFLGFLAMFSSSQNCQFDSYSKKGSLYFFSTYFENYTSPREGECVLSDNQGRIYQRRVFKNGVIYEEYTVHYESQKPYTIYHRIDRDSIIGEAKYHDVLGRLQQKVIYYWSKEHRRSFRQIDYYLNGKPKSESNFTMIPLAEMLAYGYPMPPDHIIDAEGYADDIVPSGWELQYHENGRLKSKKFHRLIVVDNASDLDQYSLEGRYEEYYENGKLKESGFYKNGNQDSLCLSYYPDGKIMSQKTFKDVVGIGVWRSYHPNGITSCEQFFNEDIYDVFTPHEKKYDENGQLIKEKKIDSRGNGFMREFYPNGDLAKEEIYEHGPREVSRQRLFYPNRQLKQLAYFYPKNDTSFVSYYENGQLETYTSNGIHRNYQVQYFPNGQLKMHYESSAMLDYNSYLHETYQENGSMLQLIKCVKDTILEEYYYRNGQKKRSLRKEKNLLTGNYLEWDSLGTQLSNCQYQKGFRISAEKVRKRTMNKLSNDEENNIQAWLLASLESSYQYRNSVGLNKMISNDSLQIMIKDLQRAISLMPDEWRFEVPDVSMPEMEVSNDLIFHYHFVIKDEASDSVYQNWMRFCKEKKLHVVKEEVANGNWRSGELESIDFYSAQLIRESFIQRFPKSIVDITLKPRWVPHENMVEPASKTYAWRQTATIDLKYVSQLSVVLINWNTASGLRMFSLYPDDLECYNKSWNWEIPVFDGPRIPWD